MLGRLVAEVEKTIVVPSPEILGFTESPLPGVEPVFDTNSVVLADLFRKKICVPDVEVEVRLVEVEENATRFLSVETVAEPLAPLLIPSEFVTDIIETSFVSGAACAVLAERKTATFNVTRDAVSTQAFPGRYED